MNAQLLSKNYSPIAPHGSFSRTFEKAGKLGLRALAALEKTGPNNQRLGFMPILVPMPMPPARRSVRVCWGLVEKPAQSSIAQAEALAAQGVVLKPLSEFSETERNDYLGQMALRSKTAISILMVNHISKPIIAGTILFIPVAAIAQLAFNFSLSAAAQIGAVASLGAAALCALLMRGTRNKMRAEKEIMANLQEMQNGTRSISEVYYKQWFE